MRRPSCAARGARRTCVVSGGGQGHFDAGFQPRRQGPHARACRQGGAGALTSDEQAEVEAYSRIGSLLGMLKSKARRALKGLASNGKAKTH